MEIGSGCYITPSTLHVKLRHQGKSVQATEQDLSQEDALIRLSIMVVRVEQGTRNRNVVHLLKNPVIGKFDLSTENMERVEFVRVVKFLCLPLGFIMKH